MKQKAEILIKRIQLDNEGLQTDLSEHAYTSFVRKITKITIRRKVIMSKSIPKKKHDPDKNGWCGYCCVAFGVLGEEQCIADRMGSTIRIMLLERLQQESSILKALLVNDFKALERALSMLPGDTDEWWMIITDCMWLIVITFGASIALYSWSTGLMLFQHPDNADKAPCCLLIYNEKSVISLVFDLRAFGKKNIPHIHFRIHLMTYIAQKKILFQS
ncbi:hypothetical protein CU098_010793 [Rhizopus stolonifer]|uniref:Uncharacterized protein n=1 Tax=Rhizopus stolonifer TaxID=4846 RepID=A0A367KJ82_RHIST|nr:hypothetical protein CU098_010793 [Rhizopus stolonifer]